MQKRDSFPRDVKCKCVKCEGLITASFCATVLLFHDVSEENDTTVCSREGETTTRRSINLNLLHVFLHLITINKSLMLCM